MRIPKRLDFISLSTICGVSEYTKAILTSVNFIIFGRDNNAYNFNRTTLVRCDAHMNELPIPCGPWELWYKDKQNYYNKVLVFGVLWWIFSFGMMIYTESMFLNWGPPDNPGPPSDMVEECEDVE